MAKDEDNSAVSRKQTNGQKMNNLIANSHCGRPLAFALKLQIRDLIKAGETPTLVARLLGVSRTTVWKYGKNHQQP
jgi:DNA invertase Pin-like site-specific DNA recombinase